LTCDLPQVKSPLAHQGSRAWFGSGARYTHQKTIFPPVEIIDIQFEYQGKALVPVKA
jgi:hypothetical protein